MINKIVCFLGLSGSWKWACKQMERGAVIKQRSTTGAVRYRLDRENQRRLQWNFAYDVALEKDWEDAKFFLQDQEATDWYVLEWKS